MAMAAAAIAAQASLAIVLGFFISWLFYHFMCSSGTIFTCSRFALALFLFIADNAFNYEL
jgi:hypothetical protein